MTQERIEVRISGVVQGVGFRPFVFGLAHQLRLTGFVTNDSAGVRIQAQGSRSALVEFLTRVAAEAPVLARVAAVETTQLVPVAEGDFVIRPSAPSAGSTSIPPDTATCVDCLAELRSPSDRRFGYPFIVCINCGPRYTIVTGLPYDRAHTTMNEFPMCVPCQGEFDDPTSRRFHAEPTACSDCGPQLAFRSTERSATGADAITATVEALQSGQIVAIKGIGGYHLGCDARNLMAVARLRERKGRGDKPFALLVRDLATASSFAKLTDTESLLLTSSEAPIVIATATDAALGTAVAPGNTTVGVMLPSTPLQHLLFDAGAPAVLVMTSGNLSDEPICIDPAEAEMRLAGIADCFCHNNRRIHVPCDDSVVQVSGEGPQPIRRSRGYAPLPLRLPVSTRPVIAVGGELKTTAAVATGNQVWLSQHIGDTENLQTLAVLARTVATLTELQHVLPEAVISDSHPSYLSRKWASEEAVRRGIPHLMVQHHHAHLASLLAEHGWSHSETVLGVTFDGTGFGTDGTIWGGEFLLGGYKSVERVGSLLPVQLPGGDAPTRRPARSALAHLKAAGLRWDLDLPPVAASSPNELQVIGRMLQTGASCTPTTSMGRYFDAVASILGGRQDVDYEGQAAVELEALATACVVQPNAEAWTPAVEQLGDRLVLNPRPALVAAIAAVRNGTDQRLAAANFHLGLAAGVAEMATKVRDRTGVAVVGLTGGVFVNRFLTAACVARLNAANFQVLTHRVVPPNDGGLALGQIAVVAAGEWRRTSRQIGV